MNYFVVALVCFGAYCSAHNPDLDEHWSNFKVRFNRQYDSNEEVHRRTIFEERVKKILHHNLNFDLGVHTYHVGLNKFSDWTLDEYSLLNTARPSNFSSNAEYGRQHLNKMALPDSVDWRKQGYVTDVKNQAACGSCWAFSSTGAMEGANMRTHNKLVSLSEQNLVDCVAKNSGCGGGWMDIAFDYVVKNGGIDSEGAYPYKGVDQKCSFEANGVAVKLNKYVDVPKTETALMNAVATIGPVAVAIDANHESFMSYQGGLYSEPSCEQNAPDHAVLVVGYGSESGFDYWIVKNSWGTGWGESGYIRMLRNNNNMCGIANYATYPVV